MGVNVWGYTQPAHLPPSLRGQSPAAIHSYPNDRAQPHTVIAREAAKQPTAAIQLFNILPKGQQIFVIASERQ